MKEDKYKTAITALESALHLVKEFNNQAEDKVFAYANIDGGTLFFHTRRELTADEAALVPAEHCGWPTEVKVHSDLTRG